jgi:hypothetical protein
MVSHVGLGGHRADVGAGREGLVAAGDDDAADGVVAIEAGERGPQLVHQTVVQRVQLLRPVQADQGGLARTFAAHFGEDELVAHGTP